MSNNYISEIFVDLAGKYRVRVILNENITKFFKFDHYPSLDEINQLRENYLKNVNIDQIS
jgi:hypothetical protein